MNTAAVYEQPTQTYLIHVDAFTWRPMKRTFDFFLIKYRNGWSATKCSMIGIAMNITWSMPKIEYIFKLVLVSSSSI